MVKPIWPNFLSLSAEIHEVLHPFRVFCTLRIALPTSTHKLQSILANKRKNKNRPQCGSAKINPARILILAQARKKDPREKKGLYSNYLRKRPCTALHSSTKLMRCVVTRMNYFFSWSWLITTLTLTLTVSASLTQYYK